MIQSSNANEAAHYRVGARLRTSRKLNVDAAECKNYLEKACVRHIQEEVETGVREVWKEVGADEGEPSLARLRSAQKALKTKLFRWRRLPRGVLTDAVKDYNQASEDTDVITVDNFQARLKRPGGNVVYWQDTMTKHFDVIWRRVAASFDSDPNSKDANIRKEASKDEDLRTCRSTLAGILRPELRPYFPQVLELLEDSQTSVSVVLQELSVIALKSVHLIADGTVYGQNNFPETRLSDILPAGFQVRDPNIPQTVKIAPLPSYLDSILENEPDSDLAQLLSQEYLQFAYSRLLREQGSSLVSADTTHPMWKNLVDAMQCEGPAEAPDGLSRTILGHVRQYATALSNHWDGATYGKLQQAVLRILLRVHLAPQREKAYKEKALALAKRKQEEVARKATTGYSKSHLKWTVAHLLDKLVIAQEENKPKLAQSIFRQ
ncbi:hypothetical protein EC968_008894, partial [Mortierella alpina]